MKSITKMSFGAGFPHNGDDNKGYQLFLSATVLVVVAAVFVSLRLYARLKQGNQGLDDWMILASMTLSFCLTIFMDIGMSCSNILESIKQATADPSSAVSYGYGMHKEQLTTYQVTQALKVSSPGQLRYTPWKSRSTITNQPLISSGSLSPKYVTRSSLCAPRLPSYYSIFDYSGSTNMSACHAMLLSALSWRGA